MRRIVILSLAAFLAVACSDRQAAAQKEALVPANFAPKTDSLGFLWDIQQQGYVQNGTNGTFGNACLLQVQGSNYSPQQPVMMTKDGEFIINLSTAGRMPSLQLSRRVKVDTKGAFVRYVEILRNAGTASLTVPVTLVTQLGNGPCQAVVSDSGQPLAGGLGKDSGIVGVANPQNGPQNSVLFYLAASGAKLKPAVQVQSNYSFQFTYSVTIPAGKTVAILHCVGQRSLTGVPDAKALAELFRPFRSSRLTSDLPSDVRKALANHTPGFGGEHSPLATIESLEVSPTTSDVLAVGDRTRLHGSATCDGFDLETRYGSLTVPVENVAAVVGDRYARGSSRVFLRDGQLLIGKVRPKNLKFSMNTGLEIQLASDTLDRLVLRRQPQDGTAAPGAVAMVETLSGERLALRGGNKQRLAAMTPWGERQPLLDDLLRLTAAEDLHGHHLALRDGSRLFAFLDDLPLSLPTLAFGVREFPPSEIRAVYAAGVKEEESTNDGTTQPRVVLTGGNLLVGRIDLPVIHFHSAGQAVPVPPDQIRVLRGQDEDGRGGRGFEADLWDGSTIHGTLTESVLPIRAPDRVSQVPVRDIAEVHVPAPTVPETLRVKIAGLIRDLGHPEFQTREAATRSLAELGDVTRLQLRESLTQASDPEVRRRVEALLAELKD